MAELSTDIRFIKGVGERRAEALAKLGIFTLHNLLCYFPRSYEDRSVITPIALAPEDAAVCVKALVISSPRLQRVRRGLELVKLRIADDSGTADVTFFNQGYVKSRLNEGDSFYFYGKLTGTGARRAMANPVFEREDSAGQLTGRIIPVYRLTAGITQKLLINAVSAGLDACETEPLNALPDSVLREYSLAQTAFAYRNIHFPANLGALELARRRLIFEELFVLAAALGRLRSRRTEASGQRLKRFDPKEFFDALPFSPTGAQKRAVERSFDDMCSGLPMNRLVQGDVGSGKTLVAAACAWLCLKNGLQAAFMAPTEILAEQHLKTLSSFLAPFGARVGLLTGSMSAGAKRQAVEALQSGATDLIVGTHALLTGNVGFSRLALVITDEQHRFGVEQRAALSAKAEGRPHVLVMSATPIPRTLALMLYGDLDVSVIDELPPGRQSVDTFVVGESYRQRIYKFMRRLVSEGRQVFVVCPMVEDSEESEPGLKSATEHAKTLGKEVFPDLRVGCIHGRMKPGDKDRTMRAFVNGELDILVSTTVIEVGVDVPNAALMVVENAERFGLSQLHQLRGRVGRGAHKSYCVLISEGGSEDTRRRLEVMQETNDGFKISEEDLKLRGPGDFFGSRQHGLPELHIADLCADMDILSCAQEAAKKVLGADPELEAPENARLAARISELFETRDAALN